MLLHNLTKTTTKTKKKLGRGYGTGKGGHTSTRGQKGQKARYSIPQWFIGTSWVWFKRLPMTKGKGLFKSLKNQTITIKLSDLNTFKKNSTVTVESLIKTGLITKRQALSSHIKVLGTGKLDKTLKVKLPASTSAITAIKKLGGEHISETS